MTIERLEKFLVLYYNISALITIWHVRRNDTIDHDTRSAIDAGDRSEPVERQPCLDGCGRQSGELLREWIRVDFLVDGHATSAEEHLWSHHIRSATHHSDLCLVDHSDAFDSIDPSQNLDANDR